MKNHRVVITGMGIHSCLGGNLTEVRQALFDGKSGIGIDPERKKMGFQSMLTGIVPDLDMKNILDRRKRQSMPQHAIYAFQATQEALANAGIGMDYLEEHEVGIIYGNDSCAKPVVEAIDIIRAKNNTTMVGSGSVFQSMNSTVSMNLSVIFKLRGINLTVAGACASGGHAIGLGYLLIKQGLQHMIICGGAQECNPYAVGSFDGIGAFSQRHESPHEASRPFSKDRDGLVPSGGGATLVIESLESALRRGSTILGEITAYGFSSNGNHISVPDTNGLKCAMKMALDQRGVSPADIDYINAHATSTPNGDIHEAVAIADVFRGEHPVISSTKSMTGHEMWMAGSSEVIYSMLMMEGGFIAPTLNYNGIEDDSLNLQISNQRIDKDFSRFMSNSFGFGGTNTSLIIEKYKG